MNGGGLYEPKDRLVRTPDGRIVPEGEGSGELVAVPGQRIPIARARELGLLDATPAAAEELEEPAEKPPAIMPPEVKRTTRRSPKKGA